MADDPKRDLLGGLISFGIEAFVLVIFGLVAGMLAWIAVTLVG